VVRCGADQWDSDLRCATSRTRILWVCAVLRGGRWAAGLRGFVLRLASPYEGADEHRWSDQRSADAGGVVDVGHPSPCAREQALGGCELERLAAGAGVTNPRFPSGRRAGEDDSSLAIAVDHEAVFSATAVFAGAMIFVRIGCWRGAARGTRPGSHLIPICQWGIHPAFRAGSAWFRARRGR